MSKIFENNDNENRHIQGQYFWKNTCSLFLNNLFYTTLENTVIYVNDCILGLNF